MDWIRVWVSSQLAGDCSVPIDRVGSRWWSCRRGVDCLLDS